MRYFNCFKRKATVSSPKKGLTRNNSFIFDDPQHEVKIISSNTGETSPYKKKDPVHVLTVSAKQGECNRKFFLRINTGEAREVWKKKIKAMINNDSPDHIILLHSKREDIKKNPQRGHAHFVLENQDELIELLEGLQETAGVRKDNLEELSQMFEKIKNAKEPPSDGSQVNI